MKYYLGIDTSNYTTSLAVVDKNNNIVCDLRKILEVKIGERGLRQSEAFFQHCNSFPEMLSQISKVIDFKELVAVAVSKQPRFIDKSYMPVFLAGYNYAQVLASALKIPLIQCSHQEGHIYAGMVPLGLKPPFLAIHLSGGTTDLLEVSAEKGSRLNIKTISSSSDLHCGQFVDRIGVHMGLGFPAGKELDLLSLKSTKTIVIPSSVREGSPSFSGPLTKAVKLLERGEGKEDIALAAFKCIAKTVEKMLKHGITVTGLKNIMLVGGVASNTYIREALSTKYREKIYFAPPKLSADNAVGVAFMGKKELGDL